MSSGRTLDPRTWGPRTWGRGDIPDQTGRTAIVTGANSGLGLEIATRLAEAGASVTLACRNAGRAAAALETVRTFVPGTDAVVGALDLSELESVERFAEEFADSHDTLDLLINNAGLMALDEDLTKDGFEMQFGVNHLGHFALTQRLLPLMQGTPGSRVATMSSFGHRLGRMNFDDLMGRREYQRWPAYFQSKLANILFASGLQRRLAAAGAETISVAAHPGATNTDLGTEGTSFVNRAVGIVVPLTAQSVGYGALPMLRAATDPDVRGGEYYGPRLMVMGWPVKETPSRRARDTAAAERLWEASVALTGLDAFA
jgi:NAD(P)-dependent dehydrogenase (short-subunit alcohol dehydrogenase family)